MNTCSFAQGHVWGFKRLASLATPLQAAAKEGEESEYETESDEVAPGVKILVLLV